jgi:uncharacterized membrane protein YebE (DUF533 family)
MKQITARICLIVAIVLFILGLFVECFCPSWYLVTASFAVIALWLGTKKTRAWAAVWLIAALLLALANVYGQAKDRQKVKDVLRRLEEKQKIETNQLQHPNSAPESTNTSNSLTH